ncbi:VOC family protein [Sphingomonas solaris]|uniref:VOC family protein n=1 Tax=Alterirhizorhabdus solaris TaxID=2529389 RepID=A0A558R1R8_9SPHN|nr:VOC family protein [Sphingomonas solaris]TVV73268.1 VOC family protein [Sphingomonas solaris]
MAPRLALVTLGVADLARATAFYEAIGFERRLRAAEGVAFFQLGPLGLSLYPDADLAGDAGVSPGAGGFRGMSLARNVATRQDVDAIIAVMLTAGGRPMRAAGEKEWGGYSGYVADPDGHAWEIAWNPGFPLGEDGAITIPA